MDHTTARDLVAACEQAATALSAAEAAIQRMPEGEERTSHLRALAGLSASLFGQLRAPAIRQYPDLNPTEPLPSVPDTLLDAEELEAVAHLSESDVRLIDEQLLAVSAPSWRKVARVVGTAMSSLAERLPDVSDGFYAQRVAELVRCGKLESQGNLNYMRFSEVRLPGGGSGAA